MESKMKKTAKCLLGGILPLAFLACSDSGSSTGPNKGVEGSEEMLFSSIPASIDQENRTITAYDRSCKLVDGKAVFNPQETMLVGHYEFRNDSLCISTRAWTDGEEVDVASGESCLFGGVDGSIYGTWYQPEDDEGSCPGTVVWTNILSSPDRLETYMDYGKVCLAKLAGYIFKEDNSDAVKFTYKDCNHFSLTMDLGVTKVNVDYVTSISATKTVTSYTYHSELAALDGKTCTKTEYDQLVTEELCTVENLQNGYIEDDQEYIRTVYEGDGCDLGDSENAARLGSVLGKISGANLLPKIR